MNTCWLYNLMFEMQSFVWIPSKGVIRIPIS